MRTSFYHLCHKKNFHSVVGLCSVEIMCSFSDLGFSFAADEKAHYAARDPITALKTYMLEHNLATESELKAIEKKIDDVVEDAVEFADESPVPSRSQLLENVFADPKGFGIGPDGKYRCEDPTFTQGTAQV